MYSYFLRRRRRNQSYHVWRTASFSTSRFGKPVILLGRHRFNKYWRSKGRKALWLCCKKSSAGCRATLTTVDDEIVRQGSTSTGGARARKLYGCAASPALAAEPPLLLSKTKSLNRIMIIRIKLLELIDDLPCAIFTESRYGNPVLLLGPYRFNKYYKSKGARGLWKCSKASNGCKVTILETEAEPKRAFLVQTAAEPKRAFLVQTAAEPNRAFLVQTEAEPKRAFLVQTETEPKRAFLVQTEAEPNGEFSSETASEPIRAFFTTSRFGKPVILIGGYRYNKYCRSKGSRATWFCCSKTKKSCKASKTTLNDVIIKHQNAHTH
ncbi:jg19948 [Pararge aegeria aegeria]|uniref:Jg19948 protein n=1 Tax=Pararge aegeria aegeria TaxID=348720 RepID=A0A8S4RV70_9NEOP|nr:jg19948 [Pararge aegeria aegeria]